MKTNKDKKLLLEQLKASPIVEYCCKKLGIGRATYYRWRKEDKKFAEEADLALNEGRMLINDLAESQLISAIKDKNMTGIMYWLRHNHPKYANRIELNEHIIKVREELSEEENRLIEEALRLAMPKKERNDESKQKSTK